MPIIIYAPAGQVNKINLYNDSLTIAVGLNIGAKYMPISSASIIYSITSVMMNLPLFMWFIIIPIMATKLTAIATAIAPTVIKLI